MDTAVAHDYVTQRGGAERVVLALLGAFPGAPLYTTLYEPSTTFPEFAQHDIRVSPLNRSGLLRRSHRLALPLLAPAASRLRSEADVTICSSSGWAHGIHAAGRKIVYCHSPAKWLYRRQDYLGTDAGIASRAALAALGPALSRWDRRAAADADLYVANSTFIAEQIKQAYGRDATVLVPPTTLEPGGARRPVDGVDPGFFLTVARLMPYKNVDVVVAAFAQLPDERLVVVGGGPMLDELRRVAPANVQLVGERDDDELRWLYAESEGLVAAAREDLGLTPIEANVFGRPVAALRFGGFLDTVEEGTTGVFFDEPSAGAVADAVVALRSTSWTEAAIRTHAERFSLVAFQQRIRELVASVCP